MRHAAILCLILTAPAIGHTIAPTVAHAESPPQITWEWFEAAETYRNYKVKGPHDLAIAAHYFRLAAQRGNAAAAYKLGEAYENGAGVPQDASKALQLYRQAAALGDKYAQLRIGWFYQKGIAVPADGPTAVTWYEASARQNNIWAFHMLAVIYAEGLGGVPQDLERARQNFEISLPQTRDSWAMWRLSVILKGRDPARARSLLEAAARAGNAQAVADLKGSGADAAPRQ